MKNENLPTQPPRELTFGEKAVGLTFNPGKLESVEKLKRLCAAVIDEMHNQRNATNDSPGIHPERGEAIAQFTLAIRRIQEGQMWGVKAATWLLDK